MEKVKSARQSKSGRKGRYITVALFAVLGLLLLLVLFRSKGPGKIDLLLEDYARDGNMPKPAELKADFCPPTIHPQVIQALAIKEDNRQIFLKRMYDLLPRFIRSHIDLSVSADAKCSAAKALIKKALASENKTNIVALLQSPNQQVRRTTCLSMYYALPVTRQGWPLDQLAAQTANPDPIVRDFVVYALTRIGEKSPVAEMHLTKLLSDHDEVVRLEAARALLSMRVINEAVVQTLENLRSSSIPEVKLEAALQLKRLNTDMRKNMSTLLSVARETGFPYRKVGLMGLSMYGTNAISFLPEIKAFYRDKDIEVRTFATNAVAAIEPSPKSPPFVGYMDIHFYSSRFERSGTTAIVLNE